MAISFLLREVLVEGEDVATDGECEAHECKAGLWEEGGSVKEREVSQREVDKGGRECMPIRRMIEKVSKEKGSRSEERWQ